MLKALLVELKLHWGYSVKQPAFSATQPSFRLPPPTTLIGAFAAAAAMSEGWPEVYLGEDSVYSSAARILASVPWATLRTLTMDPDLLAETRDLARVLIAPYVRRDNLYPGSPYVWAVQSHGKIYVPAAVLEVLYIVRGGEADKLYKYAWGITRLGSKESIVSVDRVEVLDASPAQLSEAETSFGFPRHAAAGIEGSFTVYRLPAPGADWFKLGVVRDASAFMADFIIPKGSVKVRLSNRGAALIVGGLGAVIVPREVVEAG